MDIINGLNVYLWILLPICVLTSSSSESWIKNCQQYHESSEFCADLFKMTSRMIDKRLLKNSPFDRATIKQTVETVLPKKIESKSPSKSVENRKSVEDSMKSDESNGKNSLGRSSREDSVDDVPSDEYEYFEKNLTEPKTLDSDYIPSESEENYVKELQARGKSANSEESAKDPLVKKTFGYKVTLYKNPDSKDPPVVTEEFFGDGDKKLIKILGSPKSSVEKNNEYESQPSSASRLFIPELLDDDEEKGISPPRDWSLAGTLRGHYKHAKDKGLDGVSSMKNAGDEKQRDKKGAKEKALREKTQIEFFEREKIFHDDKKGRQAKHRYIDSFAEKSAPDDSNGMNFKNLHDLLLKRLKGWREKGYKITTELEIVHRGASHDKSREVKQRGANKKALHQHLKEAIDAKKEGFMEGSKNPENSGRETLPVLDYPDVISFDPGTDHSGGERFFIRTTLAPHKLRTTKVVHYIAVAKNPPLSSGQNKKLATLSYLLGNQKQPPSIDISSILRNNFIGQKDQPNSNFQNAVSIPILASLDGTSNNNNNNDNDSARKKIIITRPINNHKLLDHSNGKIFTIGQPVIYQNPSISTSNEGPKTNLLSNVIGQPITLLQNPPTIRIAGINNGNVNSQSLYGQTFRGSPTVITLEPPSGAKPSLTDQLENLKTGFVPQVVTSPNKPKKQQNAASNQSSRPTQQPDKMKLSPVAFEEPPNKARLPPQQQNPPNERPPYFSMSDPPSDRPGMSFQGFNQPSFPPPPPPGHDIGDDHLFNDFDVDLGQPPPLPNSYSGFHTPMDPGILDTPFSHEGFNLDQIENESPPNIMENAIFPPEAPPRFQIQHPGSSNLNENNINPNDVPQWVQNLRTGSYNAMGMNHPSQILRPQQPVRVQLGPKGVMATSPRPFLNNPRPLTNGYVNNNHLNHQSKEQREKIEIPRHSSLVSPDSEIKVSQGNKLIDQVNAQITNASPLLATTIYTLGFETQVKQPKSRDLLTQSSEIYPLIGGFGPFIIPSLPIDEKIKKDETKRKEEKSSDTSSEKSNAKNS